MVRKSFIYIAGAAIVMIAIFVFPGGFLRKQRPVPGAGFSLVIEPDDGIAPVLAMIRGARYSVDLVIYELNDPQVETALADDVRRGVAVRVLLGAGYDGALSAVNGPAYDRLRAHGVPVRWSPEYFSLTHQKTLTVDGGAATARALIMTFNLVAKYYPTGRDFGIVDADACDVAAIEHTFAADWNGNGPGGTGNDGDASGDLLWSPGSSAALIDLIARADRSLSLYNEEMADMDVTKALIDAARRGVAVYVDMTGSSQWKWEFAELATAGVHVRIWADDPSAPLYIHAKMIVADYGSADERAFVGSENFSETSLERNRELGVIIGDHALIAELMKTFAADWRSAAPFAL